MVSSAEFLAVPPRTRLYGIRPISFGTPETEDLWSWLSRIAFAHQVSPRNLCVREIYPRVSQQKRFHFRAGPFGLGSGVPNTPALGAFEQLTGFRDLNQLTFAPLATAFSWRGLVAKHRRWCPYCLREDELPYFRLIWQVAPYRWCHRHGVDLRNTCGRCGTQHSTTDPWCHPGTCSRCGTSLCIGSSPRATFESTEIAYEIWQILGHALFEPRLSDATIRHCIQELLGREKISSSESLRRRVGCSKSSASEWYRGCRKVTLATFVTISRALGSSAANLLSSDHQLVLSMMRNGCLTSTSSRAKPWFRNWNKVRIRLDEAIQLAQGSVPFNQLAHQLGVCLKTLRIHFPELVSQHSMLRNSFVVADRNARLERKLAEAMTAIETVRRSGRKLSRRNIASYLEKPGIFRETSLRMRVRDAINHLPALP